MTRNKVKLAYIPNDTARKTTFKKRKGGLVKKLDELTTLCDVEACAIIYSAYDPQPTIWPSVDDAQRIIMKFRSFSEVEQGKRKLNQESFTRQRLQKMEEKLRKQQRKNRHKEITHIMFQTMIDPQSVLPMLSMSEYEELVRVTNQNLMEVERMLEMRLSEDQLSNSNPPPPPPPHPHGGAAFQNLVMNHEIFPHANHVEFRPMSVGFSMPNMGFPPPPVMAFPPPNIGFSTTNMGMGFPPLSTDFPLSDIAFLPPNMGMSCPSNQALYPYYPNATMGPSDTP